MSKNEARRQKQLAKKKAKREEKRTQMAQRSSVDPLVRLAAAEHWPVIDVLVPETLWQQGIGQLVITRRLPDGRFALANFLVDVYCLGVKDAYWDIVSEWDLDRFKRKHAKFGPMLPVRAEYLAKLVFDAVEYAEKMGIPPHPDYRHAKLLLAGIDPTVCADVFPFGKDGKPLFINGPNDTPERIKVIMHKVQAAGGDFLLMGGKARDLAPELEGPESDDDET